jgi:hypothetical protein
MRVPAATRDHGRTKGLEQLERIVVPMRERLGHAAKRPVQFAFDRYGVLENGQDQAPSGGRWFESPQLYR